MFKEQEKNFLLSPSVSLLSCPAVFYLLLNIVSLGTGLPWPVQPLTGTRALSCASSSDSHQTLVLLLLHQGPHWGWGVAWSWGRMRMRRPSRAQAPGVREWMAKSSSWEGEKGQEAPSSWCVLHCPMGHPLMKHNSKVKKLRISSWCHRALNPKHGAPGNCPGGTPKKPVLYKSEKYHGRVKLQNCYYFYAPHLPLEFQPYSSYASYL